MDTSIPEIVRRVPFWSPTAIEETAWLPGGITNRNLRVTVRGESYVIRIAGDHSELLGIDRRHELAAHRAAAKTGIAPEVVYFIEPEGYLVTRFLHANTLPSSGIRSAENLQRVAACLRRIHEMPEIPGNFSPFRTVEAYAATCLDRGVMLPESFDSLIGWASHAEEALGEHPPKPCPCHNDLLNENFLDDGSIRVVDWEYAAMGDPYFDLGNFSANNDLTDTEDRLLLEAYCGSACSSRDARLKIMRAMSHFREAMWGMVQLSLSTLDFDFAGYAGRHFARAEECFRDPRWELRLERARTDD